MKFFICIELILLENQIKKSKFHYIHLSFPRHIMKRNALRKDTSPMSTFEIVNLNQKNNRYIYMIFLTGTQLVSLAVDKYSQK